MRSCPDTDINPSIYLRCFFLIFHRRHSVIILVPIPTSSSVIPVILYTPIGLGTGAPYLPPHTKPEQRGTRPMENKKTTSDLNPAHCLFKSSLCSESPVSYVYVETILE